MKRFLPSILILLIIVNIFAPFSVRMDKNKLSLKKNIADAAIMNVTVTQTKATENSIDLSFNIHRQVSEYHGVYFIITDNPGTKLVDKIAIDTNQTNWRTLDALVDQHIAMTTLGSASQVFVTQSGTNTIFSKRIENNVLTNPPIININGKDFKDATYKFVMTNGTPNTTYYISMWAFNGDKTPEGISSFLDQPITTAAEGVINNTPTTVGQVNTTGPDSALPQCWISITQGWSMSGCIAQFIYYFFFVPTSFLFALTGVFFDWTFHYTIQDSSYSSSFVVEGWGVVRDFCNIFFIFVLLYIAFREILGFSGGHGPNTKQLIINVIIIGLLINFSLFAAQLVIDSSNILARVFYNSNSIKITKNGANGVTNSTPQLNPGPNGELQLSAALVNKVNPQNLIIEAKKVGNIKDEAGKSNQTIQSNTGVSNGTFILVTILAIAVNIVGLIVFLSIGLMCISRVVGLWIYMILAPLAFFSYTIPQMQGLKVIGWKNWWSQLMCMSFWAPLLIFFMYLILKFLETGFDLLGAQNKDGLQFVIAVIVPFAFIMTLLWRAKDLAKTMGCEIATKITGGVAAAGGLMLGGAALGAAFLGRQTVGAVAKYTQNDRARENALKFKETKDAASKIKGWNVLNPFAYTKVASKAVAGVGKFATAGVASGFAQIGKKTVGGKTTNYFQREEKAYSEKTHSEQALNQAAADLTHNKDAKYKDLSEAEQEKARKTVNKDELAKKAYGTKFENIKDDSKRADIQQEVDAYHARGETGPLSVKVKDEAGNDKLDAQGNRVTATADHSAAEMADLAKANQAVGEFVSALRKGSYDVRNLSASKSSSNKFAVGLLAAVAAGTRMGLKQSGINHGTGQKDFIKDLGNTIKEALKSVDIKVSAPSGGGGHDDHGGGHH